MKDWKFKHDRIPSKTDTCAVASVDIAKVATLLFDRIHVSTRLEPQADELFLDVPEEFTFGISQAGYQAINLMKSDVKPHPADNDFRAFFHRHLITAYAQHGVQVISTYSSEASFRDDFQEGVTIGYQAALNNLPVAENEHLTWEQVLQFRSDIENLRKYRSLRLWLKDGLKASSVQQATDVIGKRIDDYEWALKKHGIKTVVGALSSIIDSKSLPIVAIGAGTGAMLGGALGALTSTGLLGIAKCCVWVAERRLDLEVIKREQFAEVALIHEAKKLVSSTFPARD